MDEVTLQDERRGRLEVILDHRLERLATLPEDVMPLLADLLGGQGPRSGWVRLNATDLIPD